MRCRDFRVYPKLYLPVLPLLDLIRHRHDGKTGVCMASPKEILEFVKKNEVKFLDLRFSDLPGLWHHVTFPTDQFQESSFEDGFGMDGSSIRGWMAIHESDMLLIPDPAWYLLDPFTESPTLVMAADVIDPVTKQ